MTQIIYGCRTQAVRTLCLIVFATLLGLTGPSFAQKGLTVDQIIAMHKAGVPAQIIEQNIKMTNAKYKLTVKDLRKLKLYTYVKSMSSNLILESVEKFFAPSCLHHFNPFTIESHLVTAACNFF